MNRRFLPTFADLIDRLTIHQLKEVFITENKETYTREMKDIVHDLDLLIKENDIKIDGELIHIIVCLAQMNEHIWYNESSVRKGNNQDLHKLKLTHSLNGLRNKLMNKIKFKVGESDRLDLKTDCLAADHKSWQISVLFDNE